MTLPLQFDDPWLKQRLPHFGQSAVLRADCLTHAIRAVNPEMAGYLLEMGAEPDGLPLASPLRYEVESKTADMSPLGLTLHLMDMLATQGEKHQVILNRHAQTIVLLVLYGADLDRLHLNRTRFATAREHLHAHYPGLAKVIEVEREQSELRNYLAGLGGSPPPERLRI